MNGVKNYIEIIGNIYRGGNGSSFFFAHKELYKMQLIKNKSIKIFFYLKINFSSCVDASRCSTSKCDPRLDERGGKVEVCIFQNCFKCDY